MSLLSAATIIWLVYATYIGMYAVLAFFKRTIRRKLGSESMIFFTAMITFWSGVFVFMGYTISNPNDVLHYIPLVVESFVPLAVLSRVLHKVHSKLEEV